MARGGSIAHIEDLDIQDFIRVIKNLKSMKATEKLDGVALRMGLDLEGRIFTSRANKKSSAKKAYSEKDYPYFAANNGPRSVQAALEKKELEIKSALSPGDEIDLEVLYGEQPNAVNYGLDGKTFVAFIKPANDTSEEAFEKLVKNLANKEVDIRVAVVDSQDGENLDRKLQSQTVKFVEAQKINPALLDTTAVDTELGKLEQYLSAKSSVKDLTNFELLTRSLTSFSAPERDAAKAAKEKIEQAVKSNFKLPIKQALLDNFVSKVEPQLKKKNASDTAIDIEGVVLKDPSTGELIKIVDKDGFSSINQFNFAVRNQIFGPISSLSDDDPLESRGGVFGNMKIRIADLLGNKKLAIGKEAAEIFQATKGENDEETIKNVAKILNNRDFLASKTKVEAIIKDSADQLSKLLDDFKKQTVDGSTDFNLQLKSGKTIGLSKSVIKRTLITFAETKRNILELLEKVNGTKDFNGLVSALYGKFAAPKVIDESLELPNALFERRDFTDKARYSEIRDVWTLLNIYLATVLMSVIIYKTNDTRGKRMLLDKAHYRLTSWATDMSPLNFWGYPVWRSSARSVAKLLNKKVAADAFRITRKISPAWMRFLHLDLSYGGEREIPWADHLKTISMLVQYSIGLRTERIISLVNQAFNYEKLSFDEKVKFHPRLYFYVQQFVPSSPLLARMRIIQNKLLSGDQETPLVMTKGQKLLGEDGEITTSTATVSSAIEPLLTKVGTKRQIVKRKRNPEIKFVKFKKPSQEDTK